MGPGSRSGSFSTLAEGMTEDEIVDGYAALTVESIRAALQTLRSAHVGLRGLQAVAAQ